MRQEFIFELVEHVRRDWGFTFGNIELLIGMVESIVASGPNDAHQYSAFDYSCDESSWSFACVAAPTLSIP
jgi:hypothetical protein